jgi:L-lactate utilization protein LutC
MNTWTQIPTEQTILKTADNLTANGITTVIVHTKEEARKKVLSLIPDGAQVMDMTSVTLSESGLKQDILNAERFTAVKNILSNMDKKTQGREMREIGAAPDYAVGSVHAVTEDGQVLVASNSGSQLPAYVYVAEQVIWVVGVQKIVTNIDAGIKRIDEHALPLEADRARKAYGVSGSNVSKLMIIHKENTPGRITLIFIKEAIGF